MLLWAGLRARFGRHQAVVPIVYDQLPVVFTRVLDYGKPGTQRLVEVFRRNRFQARGGIRD